MRNLRYYLKENILVNKLGSIHITVNKIVGNVEPKPEDCRKVGPFKLRYGVFRAAFVVSDYSQIVPAVRLGYGALGCIAVDVWYNGNRIHFGPTERKYFDR
jgi:hypothetical protein